MTIDEAIKGLERDSFAVDSLGDPELRDAMKLGIEALKKIKRDRVIDDNPFEVKLPGESKS